MSLEGLTILLHENTNLVQLPLTDSVLVSDKGDMACNLSLHVHNAHVLQDAKPHEGFPRSQVEQRSNSEIPSGGADQPLSERRERSRPAAASPPPDAGSLAVRAASRGPLPPFEPAHVSFMHRTLKSNDRLPGLILPSKSSEPLCREAMIPIERGLSTGRRGARAAGPSTEQYEQPPRSAGPLDAERYCERTPGSLGSLQVLAQRRFSRLGRRNVRGVAQGQQRLFVTFLAHCIPDAGGRA